MHLLRPVGRDFRGGAPFTRSPVVHDSACAAPGDLREQASVAAAVPHTLYSDPRDLVARAYALLAQETDAWKERQRADLLPGSGR